LGYISVSWHRAEQINWRRLSLIALVILGWVSRKNTRHHSVVDLSVEIVHSVWIFSVDFRTIL
jgi:hypothetical protein